MHQHQNPAINKSQLVIWVLQKVNIVYKKKLCATITSDRKRLSEIDEI